MNTPYPLKSMLKNIIFNKIFSVFCIIASAIVIVFLVGILSTLITRGLPHFNFQLFTETTPASGDAMGSGGLKNAIVGSLIMSSAGILLASVLGIASATYLAEFCTNKKFITYKNAI